MPKGPSGQKRPADAIGCAVLVGQIATGEISEVPIAPRGVAGGKARAEALSSSERSKIAALAAQSRWQTEGNGMTHHAHTEGTAVAGREAVRMYPNNSLRDPVRPFENTVFELVKTTFSK